MRIQTLMAACAVLAVSSTTAHAQGAPLQVSYPQDAMMTCEQIGAEAVRMDTLNAQAAQSSANAQGAAKGAGLANALAVNGAAYSGALGRVPGLGMFANQAAAMAQQRAAAAQAASEQQIQTASTRKTIMMALYQGKGCAMAPPTPQPVAAAAPVAPAQ